MTAKRFTTKNIICSNYCVWDNNDKPYGNDEVVELLNELHEENERLHDEIVRLRTELAYDKTVNDGKDWFKVEDEHLKWKWENE